MVDPMKILARKSRLRSENKDSRGAPNRRYCPRGDASEQREKQVNIRVVDSKAVGMIDGFIRMTVSKRGPRPKPVGINEFSLSSNLFNTH